MGFAHAWAEISSAGLQHNLGVIRQQIGGNVALAAVVKGEAYGHGLLEIAQCLSALQGVDMLITGNIEEAVQLRTAGLKLPLLILSPFDAGQVPADCELSPIDSGAYTALDAVLDYDLIPSIHSLSFAERLSRRCLQRGKKARVHLRVDTNRCGLGLAAARFSEIYRRLNQLPGLIISGIYTHLYEIYSAVPEEAKKQLELFNVLLDFVPQRDRRNLTIHAANSKAAFTMPASYYDMVRAGAALYGFPSGGISEQSLKPILSLKSRIVEIPEEHHTHFGYSDTGTQRTGSRSAIVSIGGWDAPFLLAPYRGYAMIRGQRAPIQGVCMDLLDIDISNIEAAVGDEVIFLGEGIDLKDWIAVTGRDYSDFDKILNISRRVKRIVK